MVLSRLFGRGQPAVQRQGDSYAVSDAKLIAAFDGNPDNPYLVSFPRTGSHWLRMIMELYFARPSLIRVFYYPERSDYMTFHTHDLELDVRRRNVIYLYRDPVPTVYSQLTYHKEHPDDVESVERWARLYARHLDKWLLSEAFTTKKTVLTYEAMKRDLPGAFAPLCAHFGESLEAPRLEAAARRVSLAEVKKKTEHDPQVVQTQDDYGKLREAFRRAREQRIWECLVEQNPDLLGCFDSALIPFSLRPGSSGG